MHGLPAAGGALERLSPGGQDEPGSQVLRGAAGGGVAPPHTYPRPASQVPGPTPTPPPPQAPREPLLQSAGAAGGVL